MTQILTTEDQNGTAQQAAEGFYEAFRTGDVAALDTYIAPDWTDRTLPPGRGPGRDGMKQAIVALRGSVPDLQCDVQVMVISGDLVSTRIVFSGTHTGSFLGAPPTGRAIQFLAFDMHRVAGGQIVESWHLEDNLSLLVQMGVLPPLG